MKKINEIFYSLQGEGYHAGTAAVFIRFSGCNLTCDFCDTEHEEGTLMSDEEIVTIVSSHPAKMVVLTGGEPALWIDDTLIRLLHEADKYICIETNGTRKLPEGVDWITCSPKQGADKQDIPVRLTHIDEVKVVFTGQDPSVYLRLPATHYFLQPCSCNGTQTIVHYILTHPEWRLSLQTHKLIDIP